MRSPVAGHWAVFPPSTQCGKFTVMVCFTICWRLSRNYFVILYCILQSHYSNFFVNLSTMNPASDHSMCKVLDEISFLPLHRDIVMMSIVYMNYSSFFFILVWRMQQLCKIHVNIDISMTMFKSPVELRSCLVHMQNTISSANYYCFYHGIKFVGFPRRFK